MTILRFSEYAEIAVAHGPARNVCAGSEIGRDTKSVTFGNCRSGQISLARSGRPHWWAKTN